MSKLVELRGQLDDRRKKLAEVFEQAGEDMNMDNVKALEGDSAAKAAQIRTLNDEMTDLSDQIKELDQFGTIKNGVGELGKMEKHPGFSLQTKGEVEAEKPKQRTPIEAIVESDVLKSKNVEFDLEANVKTLFQTAGGSIAYTGSTAGWFPMDVRSSQFVDYYAANQPLRVSQLIPRTTTSALAITYIQEQSFTNAAVEVEAGSAKPEAALNVAPVTETVRKIAVWIPVTDEQLADVPQVRGYLENRLGFMVLQRLDSQILTGNGTAPNLKGILNRSGIQSQAKGSDPTPDAIYKGMTKIQVNDYSMANGVVMHPNDWQDVRLLRTADGIYIWGNPAEAGPERIWGLDVVVTTAETENTALVGDFRQAELAMREGLTVRVSDSHSTYFTSNITVVLVELRAALLVYREAAFCKITGV